jgi:hypothetical protein
VRKPVAPVLGEKTGRGEDVDVRAWFIVTTSASRPFATASACRLDRRATD